MRTQTGDDYILLEDSAEPTTLPPGERQRMESMLVTVLQAPFLWASPSPVFIADLERDLVSAAQRRQRTLYWLGAAGGSVLSLVGGVLVWYFWHRQQTRHLDAHDLVPRTRRVGVLRRQLA